MKYATAISPLAMNAATLPNRPIAMRRPPTSSITPAGPNREAIGAELPLPSMPPSAPKSFCAPWHAKSKPATSLRIANSALSYAPRIRCMACPPARARRMTLRALVRFRGRLRWCPGPPGRAGASRGQHEVERPDHLASRRLQLHEERRAEDRVPPVGRLSGEVELRRERRLLGRLDLHVEVARATRVGPRNDGLQTVVSGGVG